MNPKMKIPKDLWLEILKYLPVKILGQCRCVCKYFHALIISPSFMAAHIENYTQNESKSLLLYRQVSKIDEEVEEEYTLFLDSEEKSTKLKPVYDFPCPFLNVNEKKDKYFRVVGSVNGLLCLSDCWFHYNNVILLWNPLIQKYFLLPVPRVHRYTHGPLNSILGFGYDSSKGDHKVVRLVYLRDSEVHIKTPPVVQVYSLRDGTWRGVSADCLVNHCICDRWWSQCFLNGAIHWIAWTMDARTTNFDTNCLLLFDLQQDKFKRMKLPEALLKVCALDLRVSEYGGKLSVLRSVLSGGIFKGHMKQCEIWVKGEYNVGSSWSKVVEVQLDTSLDLGWVHCLRKNGELLLHSKGGELMSYDPKTKHRKGLGYYGCWLSWFTGAYAESLVLLDKTTSVKSYGRGQKRKKGFKCKIFPNGELFVEEEEVDRSSQEEEDQSAADGKLPVEQAKKFLEMEKLLKLKGILEHAEFLALAFDYGL